LRRTNTEAADPLRRGDGLGFFVDDGRAVVTMGISLEVCLIDARPTPSPIGSVSLPASPQAVPERRAR
jgi:hypothetical protein